MVEVQLHHHVGAAGYRRRFRVVSLDLQRLAPRARLEELHHHASPGSGASSRVTMPSMSP